MKWYFAINEAGTGTDVGHLAKLAVISAARFTDLTPNLLYYGARNAFTSWMEAHGVNVIDVRPSYEAAIKGAIAARWYPAQLTWHWLRTEICNIEQTDPFVLYTDIDVVFLRPVDLSSLRPRYFACAPEFEQNNWSYFNSGVMLMNVTALRNDYPRLRAHIERAFLDPANGPFNDPPVYNNLYAGMWDRLDPNYNWKPYWPQNAEAVIFHFHGPKFDTIREIIDGTWNWKHLYGQRAGTMVSGHFPLYLNYFKMMLDLAEPGSRLYDMIDGILRDGPGALPAMLETRKLYVPAEDRGPVAPPVVTPVAPSAATPVAEAAPVAPPGLGPGPVTLGPVTPAPVLAEPPVPAAPMPEAEIAWVAQGADAWQRADGRSLVFRDAAAGAGTWLAGLRGDASGGIDPLFLTDPLGRIRVFPSAERARAACDATLAGHEIPEDAPVEAAWP